MAVLRGAPIALDVKVGLPPAELCSIIGAYEGLAVRSATKVTKTLIQAGTALKLIGRAGIGVDNMSTSRRPRPKASR